MQAGEADQQAHRPDACQTQQRYRSEHGEKPLATPIAANTRGDADSIALQVTRKYSARQPQAPADGPRENDRFEGVPQHGRHDERAEQEDQQVHEGSIMLLRVRPPPS